MNKHKKFIKEAYQGKHGTMCQDWKDVILKHYPEFGIKVGDWVIGQDGIHPRSPRLVLSIEGRMAYYNDPSIGQGENNGNRVSLLRKATPEEVDEVKEQPDFKVGDWVIGKTPTTYPVQARRITSIGAKMARYNDPSIGEGENNGASFKWLRKATHEEVESHLKEGAIRRGFKKGITMICIEGAVGTEGKFLSEPEFEYNTGLDRLDAHFPSASFTVYSDGKWAVPIPDQEKPLTFSTTLTITKEEAERILGKKIT